MPNMSEAQKRDLLIGYLIDLKLGARAAEAAKVGDTPEFARKMAYARDQAPSSTIISRPRPRRR